ncbi:MAG: HlyD family efflux transporter periplasmic adaptor subunit [Pseudolabrys sp.]
MAQQPSLFRQEAVDFQRHNREWGQVALLQPLSIKVATWSITGVIALIISFLFLGQYSRKETVVGYLTPTSGTSKIFVPQLGTIREIHVNEGQQVREGQTLLTIVTDQIAANGLDVNATMVDTLRSQKDLLTGQIAAEEQRTKSERERLTATIGGIENEISQLQAQQKIQGERIRVEEEFVASAAALRKEGYMADTDFKRRQVVFLEQKQNLNSLNQQLAARQNQLTETRYSLQQLPTVMAGKIQGLRSELATAEQRIAEISGRRAYVIRAPAAGRVSMLQATVGQFADPRRLQMEIVPNESALQAELFVPTRAIGFVRPGQEVRILYEAFPYQQFGTYSGRVLKISQTILTKSDTFTPIELKEPAYRITVALDRPDIDAYGKKIPLQADMLLRADIILEKRSLISWLLDPVLSVRM